jgi:phosphatidate phosphatase APP1
MQVYPNPASQVVNIQIYLPTSVSASVLHLKDLQGRQHRAIPLAAEAGWHTLELPVEGLPAGVYLLTAELGTQQLRQRVVVQP